MKSILEDRPALKAEIDKVAEVSGYLWQRGWAERNGGNITINITALADEGLRGLPAIAGPFAIGTELPFLKGGYFYCKGTGRRFRDLAREPMLNGSIVRILDDCASYEIIADHPVMPTSELPSHLSLQNMLLETGSSYRATLHTHPIELIAMSHNPRYRNSEVFSQQLWSMTTESLGFSPLGIGFVPYTLPGSVALADITVELMRKYDVVLWEKHGTVAVGGDILDAFDVTDVMNKAACVYMTARNMGFEPEGLSSEAIDEIRTVFSLPLERNK